MHSKWIINQLHEAQQALLAASRALGTDSEGNIIPEGDRDEETIILIEQAIAFTQRAKERI